MTKTARSRALLGVSLAALLASVGATSDAQVMQAPIKGDPVAIDSGRLAGQVLPNGVKAYLGVPFAAAPVNDLRWREPQPVKPWSGTFYALKKAPECMQVLRSHNINHYFGEEATSEDCLYANIWTPADAKPGAKLPVVVFIYGGGSTIGSSGMANYGGQEFAKKGAIFVNFNYRVGAFGYMAHPELTAESPHHASGNYALLDQVAALQWINRNIARFGGDPSKVVITGQSAGAGSVSMLQASPLAKGLFRGVVAMSGAATGGGGRTRSLAEAEKTGLQMQAALKAGSLADMRNIPADRILGLQADCQLGCSGSITVGGANVDGYFLPRTPDEIFAAHQQSDVPVILGHTHDESSNALRQAANLDEYRAAARRTYGAHADEFLKLYPATTDAQAAEMGRTAAREGIIGRSMRNWALVQAKEGKAPVYMYMFSRVHPYAPGVKIADQDTATIGAYHTSDVPYWFNTFDAYNMFRTTRNWGAWDKELTSEMGDAMVAFANTGDPNTAKVKWGAWTPANEQLIEFGDSVRMLPMDKARWSFQAAYAPAGGGGPTAIPATANAPLRARD